MKTKYERMSREEKHNLYNRYKKDKVVLYKKLRNMFLLCYMGIGYSIVVFIYDFFFKRSKINYILDIIIFVFCLLAYLKIYSIKKDLLNDYVLKLNNNKKK